VEGKRSSVGRGVEAEEIMTSWEIKNLQFVNALEGFEDTLPELLENNLGDVSKEQRELLACLVVSAFDCLRTAMINGSDRLAAVKLVLQLSGLMKDQSKLPKQPKTPPPSGIPASNTLESLQD
jgi:hypothetical protein